MCTPTRTSSRSAWTRCCWITSSRSAPCAAGVGPGSSSSRTRSPSDTTWACSPAPTPWSATRRTGCGWWPCAPAFLAAVLGLGLNYAAYEAEIYRGALQAVSSTQLEAARTLGFSEAQILRLVRGPQALRYALAPMTNDFVALLKDSSLVSVITVVELTKQTAIYATNVGRWIR